MQLFDWDVILYTYIFVRIQIFAQDVQREQGMDAIVCLFFGKNINSWDISEVGNPPSGDATVSIYWLIEI